MIRPIARAILPHQTRASLRTVRKEFQEKYRSVAFALAFAEFRKLESYEDVDKSLLDRLTYCWGNHYSAHIDYMVTYLHHASQSIGPILECGSGLSTLLLGVVAARNDNEVWTLEHNAEWGDKVQRLLHHWRLASVRLTIDNLQYYDDFEWYRVPSADIPQQFAIVVCDGPPGGDTYGGRYGLLPVMAKYFGVNCSILLDDYERAEEQEIVTRWQNEIPCVVEAYGDAEQYAVITVEANYGQTV